VPGAVQEDNPAKGLITIAHSDLIGFFRTKMPTHTFIFKNEDFSRFLSLKNYMALLFCFKFFRRLSENTYNIPINANTNVFMFINY